MELLQIALGSYKTENLEDVKDYMLIWYFTNKSNKDFSSACSLLLKQVQASESISSGAELHSVDWLPFILRLAFLYISSKVPMTYYSTIEILSYQRLSI